MRRDVAAITETHEPDDRGAAGEDPSMSDVGVPSDGESTPLLCWICRRPLGATDRVRWRGEPVHRDCL